MPRSEFRQEDTERRLTLILSVSTGLLLCGLLYVTYGRLLDYYEGVQEMRRYNRQKIAIDAMMSSLRDTETGLRGFMLTNDDSFLQPFWSARTVYARAYMAADSSFIGPDRPALDSLDELSSRVLEHFQERLAVVSAAEGARALTHDEMVEDKEMMDRVRALHTSISERVVQARMRYLRDEKASRIDAPGMVVLFAAIAVVAMAFLFWRLSTALARAERTKLALSLKVRELDDEIRARTALQGRVQKILDVSPSGILTLQALRDGTDRIVDFECVSASARAHDLLGRSPLEGTRISQRLPNLRPSGLFEVCVDVAGTGDPAYREFPRTEQGLQRWYGAQVVQLNDGVMLMFTDITDQKRRTETEQEAEKLALTGQITRTVTHEVRNPLTNIHLALEQLQDEVADARAGTAPFFQIIDRNLQRINTLIKGMLESSRKRDLSKEPARLADLVTDVLLAAKDRMELKQMRAVVDVPADLPRVLVDDELMVLALTNIAVNAVEAMQPASGVLRFTARKRMDGVVLEITDNGRGIAQENIKRLFEPFYSGRSGGLGLGLTTTRSILNSHGIHFDVHSELGVGTTFRLLFPQEVLVKGLMAQEA